MLVAIGDELRCTPSDLVIPPYGRQPDGTLLSYFAKHMTRIQYSKIQKGTVLIFSYFGSPYHAGVVMNPDTNALIHAYAARGKVVYDYIDNTQKGRKLVAAYDFAGVVDG